MKKYTVFAIVGIMGMGLGAYQSYAYDPIGHEPVLERVFKEFSPAGLKLGTFNVFPSLSTGIDYTTNTTKSSSDEESESIWRTRANLTANSSNERFETTFSGRLDNLDYRKTDSFDHTNFSGFAGFKYRFSPTFEGRIDGDYQRVFQTRYDNGTINAAYDPIQVDEYGIEAGLKFQPGSIRWDVFGGYRDVDYRNTTITDTGAELVQDDRDQKIYNAGVKLSLQKFSRDGESGYTPFMGLNYSRTEFRRRNFVDATQTFTGADQSNSKYDAHVGIDLKSGGKLRGTARVGYGAFSPDDNTLNEQTNAVMSIDLTYLYTPLTNFIFGADRFFTNSTDSLGGTLQTRLNASVVHELTRQWILRGDLVYIDRSFNENSEDQTWRGGLGFNYRMNRNLSFNGDLEYISRESNVPNGDYDEARAMLRINTKF